MWECYHLPRFLRGCSEEGSEVGERKVLTKAFSGLKQYTFCPAQMPVMSCNASRLWTGCLSYVHGSCSTALLGAPGQENTSWFAWLSLQEELSRSGWWGRAMCGPGWGAWLFGGDASL